jgi:hypothetical protein
MINSTASKTLLHVVSRTLRCTALGMQPAKKKENIAYFITAMMPMPKKCSVKFHPAFIWMRWRHIKPVTTLKYSFIKQDTVRHYLTVSTASFFMRCQTILFYNGPRTDMSRKFNSVCVTNTRTVCNVRRLQAWVPTDPVQLTFYPYQTFRLQKALFSTLSTCVSACELITWIYKVIQIRHTVTQNQTGYLLLFVWILFLSLKCDFRWTLKTARKIKFDFRI